MSSLRRYATNACVCLAACQAPDLGLYHDSGLPLPSATLAPPPGALALTTEPIGLDVVITSTVTGAEPGAHVRLFRTFEGIGDGLCPPQLPDTCLDILSDFALLDLAVADGTGTAQLRWAVPGAQEGRRAWLQAVSDLDGVGDTSNVLEILPGDLDGDDHTPAGGDCDESDPYVYEGAAEVCDGRDNDCDGGVDDDGLVCPCSPHDRADSRYLFCPDERDWDSAEAECLRYGYQLAAINDADENQWLVDTALAEGWQTDAWELCWVGGTDTSGSWVWTSGEPFGPYTPWNPGEPNDGAPGGEDCLALNDLTQDATWNDLSCWHAKRYVCELK